MARRQLPAIRVLYHPTALDELLTGISAVARADVIAKVDRLNGRTHQEIAQMLDGRSERKIFQWEGSAQGGTLRIVFAWGIGCLWMIGAFIKVNDKEGERYMNRIRPRANEVKSWNEQR